MTRKADTLHALTDQELAERVLAEIKALCGTDRLTRKRWTMSVPVDFDRDSDVIFSEMLRRFELLSMFKEVVINDDETVDTGTAGDADPG